MAHGVLILAPQELEIACQVERPGAQLERDLAIMGDGLDDDQSAVDLEGPLGIDLVRFSTLLSQLFITEPLTEFLGQVEQGEPEIEGTAVLVPHGLRQADTAVTTRTGSQIGLEHFFGRLELTTVHQLDGPVHIR